MGKFCERMTIIHTSLEKTGCIMLFVMLCLVECILFMPHFEHHAVCTRKWTLAPRRLRSPTLTDKNYKTKRNGWVKNKAPFSIGSVLSQLPNQPKRAHRPKQLPLAKGNENYFILVLRDQLSQDSLVDPSLRQIAEEVSDSAQVSKCNATSYAACTSIHTYQSTSLLFETSI